MKTKDFYTEYQPAESRYAIIHRPSGLVTDIVGINNFVDRDDAKQKAESIVQILNASAAQP